MKVLILAAGYGTRLYPLTKETPKPLLEIEEGKPLIDYLIEKVYRVKNVTEIFVVTNDKFYEKFRLWAKTWSHSKIPVTIVSDGTTTNEDRLGSIGDIDFVVRQKCVAEDLLVIGGDNLFNFSLEPFFVFASQQAHKVCLGVYDIRHKDQARQFGVVALETDRTVSAFEEKPEHPNSSLIAMCLYYLPVNTLALIRQYIETGGKLDRAGDYIHWLCEQKQLCGFQFLGSWYDIGSLEAYYQAQNDFRQRKLTDKEE